ncbi:hypothetical protein Tco_0040442 [Tanacetum coccineum]
MPTEMELTLEQTQQGVSYEVSFDESNTHVLERFYTSAGNPVKEILLKLNLPDHRILKDGGEVKEFQRSFRHSDTERLSRSDEVLKLKNFKKDATLKLSKSTNQEWYEHVGPEVTRSQDDKAEEGPTNFTLMAYTSSSSSSSDTEVSTCSKACLKSYETLKEHYDNLTKDFSKSQLNVGAYKAGLESVEAKLEVYKKNEAIFEEDIKILKLDIKLRDNALTEFRKKFEKVEKERDDLKLTLEKFRNSSKNLSKLLEIQVSDKFKTGVGFDSQVNDKYKTSEGYHAVPPPYNGNFMPPKPDLVLADEEEYVFSESIASVPAVATNEVKTSGSKPKSVSESLIEDWISDSESENETEFMSRQRKPSFAKNNARRVNHQNSPRISHPHPKGNFVPRAVLIKSGLKTLKTARQNSSRAAISVNTARPINTAYPRPTVNCERPASNIFNKAHSHVKRPFNKFTINKNSNFNEKVNTVRGNVTTVRTKAVVSDNKGNEANAVKASACWIWRPKQKVFDHLNSLSFEFKDDLSREMQKSQFILAAPAIKNSYDGIGLGCTKFMTGSQKPKGPPTSTDLEWNKSKTLKEGPTQSWISTISHAEEPSTTFNQLMSTPIDFYAYIMNRLKIKNLTQEVLLGPAFDLLKGTCKKKNKNIYADLEYDCKEMLQSFYQNDLNWNNLKAQTIHSFSGKPFIDYCKKRSLNCFD